MQRLRITIRNRNAKKGTRNEERICKMRILQNRYPHGNMQTSSISYDDQRKRIHILLPEMRPAISTKKEEIELPLEVLKAYSPLTVSRQLQVTGYCQKRALTLQQKLHTAVLNKPFMSRMKKRKCQERLEWVVGNGLTAF